MIATMAGEAGGWCCDCNTTCCDCCDSRSSRSAYEVYATYGLLDRPEAWDVALTPEVSPAKIGRHLRQRPVAGPPRPPFRPQRRMFSCSGYLPKRLRRSRKAK